MNDRTKEADLIARAITGDDDAFGELVQPYEAKVYNLAFRMCGNREDACDLAQEAFLKAFRALGHFKGESSFSTWLYRVVSNTCLDQFRRQKRAGATTSLDGPIETEAGSLQREFADPAYEPEEMAVRSETAAEIQAAIRSLPPDHRLAILLRDVEGLSYGEVALAMSCNLGTVKSRISRARAALRNRLVAQELSPQAGVYSVGPSRPAASPRAARPSAKGPGGRGAKSGTSVGKGVDA